MLLERTRSIFSFVFILTAIALGVRLFLVEDYRVSSDSMAPALLNGDLIFVNKAAYNIRIPFSTFEIVKLARPHVGDIVAFTLPDRGIETFAKRVVAIEGDRVEIRDGQLIINNKVAQYQPAQLTRQIANLSGIFETEKLRSGASYVIRQNTKKENHYGPVDVPKGYFFALSDDREELSDSRAWGPIPYACLKGKLSLLWLSIDPSGDLRKGRWGKWLD